MRGLLWLLAVFALAAALSVTLRGNEAYAVFVIHPWRVEVSMTLLILVLLLAFALGYAALRMIRHTLSLPSHVRAFRERRREEKGRELLFGAIQALFEGRFGRARKLAAQARERDCVPPLADLIAARAAQRMRDFPGRDEWLERAGGAEGDWREATLMTRAELLLEERRYDDAREVLRELHASGPRRIATLTLLLRAEQGLGNWDEVLRLARLLEKRSAMPAEAIEGVRVNARVALLARMAQDPKGLAEQWRRTPVAERVQPRVAATAARALIQAGGGPAAHRIIEEALEHQWHPELVLLYGECRDQEVLTRIERAEQWLRSRPRDAELLLTLGRLCMQGQLWGKASSYLEASLAQNGSRSAHIALAELNERTGRADEATRHYRAAAEAAPA